MHDPCVVRGGERRGDLRGAVDGAIDREAAGRNRQRFAGDVLHDDEVDVALAPDRVDRDDVRVIERGRGPRLVEETAGRLAVARGRQHLDRDGAVQDGVARPVDGAHAPLAEECFDDVV